MNQLKLINATGANSKVGRVVKMSTKQNNAFIYAPPDDASQVFIMGEDGIKNGGECLVSYGGAAPVFVRGNVKCGDIIRSRKSGDANDRGACFVAKAADSPYIQIGTALESGKRQLINVALQIMYIQ